MFPPKTPPTGSRNQPRTSSSKPTKNISKPRCEAWVPLNGWEQGDEAESDIFYLAIDAWAKRNSKIKADAPKGVPSYKIHEPFLCTTEYPCTGILDFEAFTNVSLSLHRDVEEEKEECLQDDMTNLSKELSSGTSPTSKADSKQDTSKINTIDKVKSQAEQPKKEIRQPVKTTNDHSKKEDSDNSNKKENEYSDKKEKELPSKKGDGDSPERTNTLSNTPKITSSDAEKEQRKEGQSDVVTHGPAHVAGGDSGEIENENIHDWMSRNSTSHSAPVSRTQQREPLRRRGGSAKSKSAEDRLRRAALKNSTKSKTNSRKVSVTANPVKISYAHAGNHGHARAGIFAGDLPMSEAVDLAESEHAEGTDSTPSESPTSDAARRTSLDNRLLIEEVIKDSKKIDYMSKTSVVSIGDLLSTAPRLERRQGQHSNGRDSMYPTILNEDDATTSRESFGARTSPRPAEDIRSPSTSSLPPVPVASRNPTPVREVHSSHSDGRNSGPRQAVNLNSAKIPIISYRKATRRDAEDIEEAGEIKQERKTDLDDMRVIKYNDSIMSAIQETTVELDKELTNRLLKSALARETSRVHSAGYVRQVPHQQNDSTTHQAAKSGGKNSDQKSKRGPPAFRPQSFKTPLQRAVENAHKKIYGQHYYLFNNNSGATGEENGEDNMRNGLGSAMGLRAQSANGETTNAYVWKENIESQQRHRRKALLLFSKSISYSGSEKPRAQTTNGRTGYKVSDFKPNFKADTLKTERRKTIQR